MERKRKMSGPASNLNALNEFNFCIINLKVISQIPHNRRLKTTSKGYFTLEDDNILVPFKRALFGESREKLVRDMTFLMNKISAQSKNLLQSKHLTEEDTDEKRIILSQIASLYRELERSVPGLENLKETYENDKLTGAQLDSIKDLVLELMREINLKVPNVENLIEPIVIDEYRSAEAVAE